MTKLLQLGSKKRDFVIDCSISQANIDPAFQSCLEEGHGLYWAVYTLNFNNLLEERE